MAAENTCVHINTFRKYHFHKDFEILNQTDDGYIRKISCKVCTKHLVDIRAEARRRGVKGSALTSVLNYAEGVEYIHKTNLARHVKSGGLHDWAKNTFDENGNSSKSEASSSTTSVKKKVPIDQQLRESNRLCFKRLFQTALYVITSERPFSDFEGLIKLQRDNGLTFLEGHSNDKQCRQFLGYIAKALQSDIQKILERANFFSGMMDGSQARKTGSEKELVYTKVVINGYPVELLLQCQHMADFGGEDAAAVKKAFDSAYLETYKLDEDRFTRLLISVCCDGASVNVGVCKGATTKMKENRDWLLVVHCCNHRLELAIQDAFKSDESFKDVDDFLTQVYYMFRNSGKAKRLLMSVAVAMNVTCVSFVKASGTRFQNHKYAAIKALIVNFLPLCLYLENMISESTTKCKAEMKAKLRGYLKKLQSYRFLASLYLYHQVLQQTAHLSFLMERQTTMVTDVVDAISEVKTKLAEITEGDISLPFQATEEADRVTVSASATNLPASLAFRDKNKLTKKEKDKVMKYTHSVNQQIQLRGVNEGKRAVANIKTKLIGQISTCIDKRFDNLFDEREIYQALTLADYTCWDFDDKDSCIDKISQLAKYFAEPLSLHGFILDRAYYEFRHLKKMVGEKFRNFKNKAMCWRSIFSHHSDKFPHILLLIELCLVISVSSATVERGFSTAGRLLTDSRLSMRKVTLNDLMQVKSQPTCYEGA